MWDIKYRPKYFSEVMGQEGPAEVLKARIRKGHGLDTSYIFSGGAGRGKTTLARILARALLCQNLTPEAEPCNECDNCKDILAEDSAAFTEMDAASGGTLDNVKDIVKKLPFIVQGASKKVYLFDECHRMSKDAQDALLKPIEDKKMVAILCTTEADKIRGTIQTRCEKHNIRTITREDILKRMKYILDSEGVEYVDDAVMTVIDRSGGHVRDIINKLEMLGQLGPVTVESVRDYLNLNMVSRYYEILLALGSPAQSIALAEEVMENLSPEDLCEGLAEAAMNSFRLANKMFADFSYVDRALATKVYEQYGPAVTHLAEYFLRSYRVSKTSLISDLVACQAGVPDKSSSAPVVKVVGTTAPSPVPTQAQVSAPVQKEAVAPAPSVPAAVVSKTPVPPAMDPAYTEVERKALPATMPRDNSRGVAAVGVPLSGNHSANSYMPANEFRAKLKRLMQFGKGQTP